MVRFCKIHTRRLSGCCVPSHAHHCPFLEHFPTSWHKVVHAPLGLCPHPGTSHFSEGTFWRGVVLQTKIGCQMCSLLSVVPFLGSFYGQSEEGQGTAHSMYTCENPRCVLLHFQSYLSVGLCCPRVHTCPGSHSDPDPSKRDAFAQQGNELRNCSATRLQKQPCGQRPVVRILHSGAHTGGPWSKTALGLVPLDCGCAFLGLAVVFMLSVCFVSGSNFPSLPRSAQGHRSLRHYCPGVLGCPACYFL